jgi:acetyl-CoA C-acetyltransferase
MTLDARLPVLIGAGEITLRPGEEPADAESREPGRLMAEALRLAAEDAGGGEALLRRAQTIAAVPPAAWMDGDPGRRVAELLGLDGVHTMRSSLQGGNGPQRLVNAVAARIAAGDLDLALVCGAEAVHTLGGSLRSGTELPWPKADGSRQPGEVLEGESVPGTEEEAAVGAIAPLMMYPLLENALMAAAGRGVAEHLSLIAGLWSRFSAVAASHPHAWTRREYSPAELATPSAENRRVTFPYLKLLNSNIGVDQAAALILCSVQTARALGVARDRWVFVHAGAQAADEWFVSHRRDLHRSPAIAACGRAVFSHAGRGPDDLGPVDLYSCFPAAVQIGAAELGLSLERELTCTGGLTFFGGPGNNYATHGIAAVARRLREAPAGTLGLATALGWYATKHAIGLYGNAPPSRAFASIDAAPEHPAPREVAPPGDHVATAETCTLVYERDGSPSYGILFALLDDGRRVLGQSRDPTVMAHMASDGFLAARVRTHPDRSFEPA